MAAVNPAGPEPMMTILACSMWMMLQVPRERSISRTPAPVTRPPSPLLLQADGRDLDTALAALDHVVDGQGRRGGAHHGLHLHAGAVEGVHLDAHAHPRQLAVGLEQDVGPHHPDRVAQRD